MTSNERLLISPKDAAKLMCISERTLWTLTATGKLPCVKIGKIKRYAVRDLNIFITQQTQNPILVQEGADKPPQAKDDE